MDVYQIVFCTTPDTETARKIANHLIENKLAACCNLFPTMESIYYLDNKIEQSQEILLMIKSMETHYKAIEEAILSMHPYDVPEIIATPIRMGSSSYLNWINKTLKGAKNNGT